MVAKAPGAHQTGHHLGQRLLGWALTLRKQGGLGWGREVGLGGGSHPSLPLTRRWLWAPVEPHQHLSHQVPASTMAIRLGARN